MNKEVKLHRKVLWMAFNQNHQGTRSEKRRAWRKSMGMAQGGKYEK